MEYVLLSNVPVLPDIELTRTMILELCSAFGEVGDVVISQRNSLASVSFYDPMSAQGALVRLDGTFFLGHMLGARIAPPPRTWLPGYIVMMRPTRTILVEMESYLRVQVKLRRSCGVASVTSVAHDACLVVANSIDDAVAINRYLSAQLNRLGKPILLTFLRKDEGAG